MSFESDHYTMHGGPGYAGKCPKCKSYSGCYDALCDDCASEPVICEQCGRTVLFEQFNEPHGICQSCVDENAEAFTKRFKAKLQTINFR